MISDRSLAVLQAIVNDFINGGEPVGSKSIVEKHSLGVSAATIRNDMALLEEEELIVAPHTSSGRIPTDKGYRLYVDTLAKIRPLSNSQKIAIERFLGESHNLDDMMTRTVRLLSNLTNQVAIIQYPPLQATRVRHVEMVPVATDSVLIILLTNTARIDQRIVRVDNHTASESALQRIKETLNQRLVGTEVSAARLLLSSLRDEISSGSFTRKEEELALRLLTALDEQIQDSREERITVAGTSNLAKVGQVPGEVSSLLEAIEEQVVLLRLIQELVTNQHGVGASIGRENIRYGLEGTSFLATPYVTYGDDSSARLGVFGPTRMDYARNISAMRAVSAYVNKYLGEVDLS